MTTPFCADANAKAEVLSQEREAESSSATAQHDQALSEATFRHDQHLAEASAQHQSELSRRSETIASLQASKLIIHPTRHFESIIP